MRKNSFLAFIKNFNFAEVRPIIIKYFLPVGLFWNLQRFAQKAEAGAGGFQNAVFSEFADLCGHGTALHTQIVCQGLAVKGNGEFSAAGIFGLICQVGQQLFPGGALGEDLNLLVKL